MTRRLLAQLVFAFAAAAALAASMGVAVPHHQEVPGTPPAHEHVLGAYRFSFLLSADDGEQEISPAMAKLHRTLAAAGVPMDALAQMPGMSGQARPTELPIITSAGLSPIQDLAIEFALLVIFLIRLARPTRRVLAELPLPRIPLELWRFAPALTPPRLVVLP
jgi:hypothetical protein